MPLSEREVKWTSARGRYTSTRSYSSAEDGRVPSIRIRKLRRNVSFSGGKISMLKYEVKQRAIEKIRKFNVVAQESRADRIPGTCGARNAICLG